MYTLNPKPLMALVPLSVLCLVSPISAQATTWLKQSGTGPSARALSTMVYDGARKSMLLFGGTGSKGIIGETWRWKAGTWTQLFPKNSPGPRHAPGMVCDAARKRVVLFGGFDGKRISNDTWEWDGTNWLQRKPLMSPPARHHHAMAYDSVRKRVVLFGGWSGSSRLQDTWEWDGQTWNQKTTATTPVARYEPSFAFDSARSLVLMFGGSGKAGVLKDMWAWNGSKWTPLLTLVKVPPAREYGRMVFDVERKVMVLFGGSTGSQTLRGTWEFNGKAWTKRTPLVSAASRFGAAMAYDSDLRRVVMHGGSQGWPSTLNDTHIYTTTARLTPFGTGCGGTLPVTLTAKLLSYPISGKTFGLNVTNSPKASTFAVMSLGGSKTFLGPFPLPLDLTTFSMPGCKLYNSYDLRWIFSMKNGSGLFSLPIPTDTRLVGSKTYLQAMVLAKGANGAGLLASNGAEMVIWNK